VVTVSGKAVREPNNIEVPIGAQAADLIAFCGGFSVQPESLVNGGPMMGQPLPGLDVRWSRACQASWRSPPQRSTSNLPAPASAVVSV
jgi:Na+-translocating ferredoxin:NAD+ oxidoreductase RnfC subunit